MLLLTHIFTYHNLCHEEKNTFAIVHLLSKASLPHMLLQLILHLDKLDKQVHLTPGGIQSYPVPLL